MSEEQDKRREQLKADILAKSRRAYQQGVRDAASTARDFAELACNDPKTREAVLLLAKAIDNVADMADRLHRRKLLDELAAQAQELNMGY